MRHQLVDRLMEAQQRRILVTIGTDAMLQTAQWLQEQLQNCHSSTSRLVVFTGAFTPEAFKDSDADFNIGLALGALQSLSATSTSRVYVAMNGLVCPCESMERDPDSGQFLPCRRPRSRDMTLTRPRSGEMTQPRSGEMTQPRSGEMAQFRSGAMSLPRSGKMTQPLCGEMTRPRSREHLRQRSLESLLDTHNGKSLQYRSTGSSRDSLLDRIAGTEPDAEPAPEPEPRLPSHGTPPDPARRRLGSAPAPLTLPRGLPPPATSPLHLTPPPPATAVPLHTDADAVFSESVQYLQAQRASSCPQIARPSLPPRPSQWTFPRREPETTSDPSLAAARRPVVRTNGSLVAARSGSSGSSSFQLRRSAALPSLPAGDGDSPRASDVTAEVVSDDVTESPLSAQKKTGLRRTLPPGWRHLPQRALEDLLEEEEGEQRQLVPRPPCSLLRRVSEGGQVSENIAEEYL